MLSSLLSNFLFSFSSFTSSFFLLYFPMNSTGSDRTLYTRNSSGYKSFQSHQSDTSYF